MQGVGSVVSRLPKDTTAAEVSWHGALVAMPSRDNKSKHFQKADWEGETDNFV